MSSELSKSIARGTIFILLVLPSTLFAQGIPLIGKYSGNLTPFPNAIGATSDNNARNVSVDSKGIVYCVWHNERFGVGTGEMKEIYLKCFDGKKWAEEVRITNDKVQSTCPSVMSCGEYTYLVFSNNVYSRKESQIYRGDIFLVRLQSGRTLGKPIKISESGSAGDPSLFVDHNNKMHVVWNDFQNGNWIIYYRCMNPGGKLDPIERISLDSDSIKEGRKARGNNVRPSVAVDRKGKIHIIWLNQPKNENAPGFHALCHKIKSSSDWGKLIMIDHVDDFLSFPSSCIDLNGKMHVSYGKGFDTKLYHSSYEGESWTKPQLFYDVPGRLATHSSIITDSKLNIHIVWDEAKSQTDVDIFYGKKSLGKFSKILRITGDNKYSGCPTITSDQEDNLHIMWHDKHDGTFKIYYFKIDTEN